MKNLINSLVVLGFAALSYNTHASLIIDQNQPNAFYYISPLAQSGLAQSFQQTNNNIAGAGIFLYPGLGTTDTATISLWDAQPNQVGANMLTSASGTANSGSWFDVFWTPQAVTSGTTYYLEFTSVSSTLLGVSGFVNDPYAFGQVYASGFSFPTLDYAFRTYYDDQYKVPEPASIILFALGMAGMFFSIRRAKA